MKKLIFLFLLIPSVLIGQTTYHFRGHIQQVYKTGSVNDTTILKHSGDSAKLYTSKDFFAFNKPIYANGILLGAGGGVTPTDGPWKWSTNKYTYYPDSTGTGAVGGWYLGSQTPTKLTRYLFNGEIQPASTYTQNKTSGYGHYIYNTSTGKGIDVYNQSTGIAINVANASTGTGINITSSSGTGISLTNSGSGASSSFANNSTGKGIDVNNWSTGIGVSIANFSTGDAVKIFNTSTGSPFSVWDGSSNKKSSIDKDGQVISGDGTNNATLSPTTGLRLNGTATVWDDLMFTFETGKSGATDIPEFIADSSYYVFTVDTVAPSQCIKYFTVQMPHKWKEGSSIYPHVHYKHETAVGTPNFIIKYKWYNTNESTTFGWNWYKLNGSTGNTNNTIQMAYGGPLSATGKTISSILICQLYLQSNPSNVKAYQFDIHIECDALGSSTQSAK